MRDNHSAYIPIPDSPKALRETLCVAATAVGQLPGAHPGHVRTHLDRLQRLIDAVDQHRPLGPDGRHGDRHTPTCGCSTPDLFRTVDQDHELHVRDRQPAPWCLQCQRVPGGDRDPRA